MKMKPSNSLSPYTLIESGHYYKTIGPTQFSLLSQKKCLELSQLMGMTPKSLQFIDDVHIESGFEKHAELLQGNDLTIFQNFHYDYSILESETIPYSFKILDALKKCPYTSHELKQVGDTIYFKKIKLMDKGMPTCVLMDAGLTLIKQQELGFLALKNILHHSYLQEQEQLNIIIHAMKKTGVIHQRLSMQPVLV